MSWKRGLLFALVVIPLALATRWGGDAEAKGARFHPWPDTVEYAAEAQALARTGRVFLQIGPHEVRPRFPPGWPLLIAGAVRAGVEGQDLWRISGVFGAALAWLLAISAAGATGALGPHHPGPLLPSPRLPPSQGEEGEKRDVPPLPVREGGRDRERGPGGEGPGGGTAPILAGLLAGCVWAFAPIAAGLGQTLMSDEPTALVSLAGLLLAGLAFLGDRRRPLPLALAGGLAFGLAASMRSVAAALMLLPLLFFLIGAARRLGLRAALPRALAWTAGALVFPALTAWIVVRSGLQPWEWSGYRFWMPNRFDHWTSTFNLRFALQPDTAFRQAIEGRPLSHLELALRVLLGIPGLRPHHYLGLLWPVAGWLSAIPLYRIARRHRPAIAAWAAPGLLLWTLAHVAIFSLYFYPSSRFYLAPLALCLVLLATLCGLLWDRARWATGIAALLVAILTAWTFVQFQREPLPDLETGRTRAKFTRWLEVGDEQRRGRVMPFDPVHAQALCLLTPEVAAGIREWGELPDTVEVRRLRMNGFLPALESPRR